MGFVWTVHDLRKKIHCKKGKVYQDKFFFLAKKNKIQRKIAQRHKVYSIQSGWH